MKKSLIALIVIALVVISFVGCNQHQQEKGFDLKIEAESFTFEAKNLTEWKAPTGLGECTGEIHAHSNAVISRDGNSEVNIDAGDVITFYWYRGEGMTISSDSE